MKRIFALLLAAFLLPGTLLAKDECEFLGEIVNSDTQEITVQTSWERITHDNAPGDPSTTPGRINATKEGEAVMLGMLVPITYYADAPAESGVNLEDSNMLTKKGAFDPRLDPYIEKWETTPMTLPQGIGLRVTLADQTTVMLTTVRDAHGKTTVTKPLWDNNSSTLFRLSANVNLRFALDADAIAGLSGEQMQSMRLRLPDRYVNFGGRRNSYTRMVNKKSRGRIQEALKCIL